MMKTKKEYLQSMEQHLNKVNTCGMMFLETMTRCISKGKNVEVSTKEKAIAEIAYSVLVSDLDEEEIERIYKLANVMKWQNMTKRKGQQ